MNSPDVIFVRELSIKEKTPLLNHPVLPELEANGFFNNHQFTFVGVYYSVNTNCTVIGYPKYLPEHLVDKDIPAIVSHMNLICRVVEQAKQHLDRTLIDDSYSFYAYGANKEHQYVNRYTLATTILQDYMTYGIYYNKLLQVARNGNGPIQWHTTIQKTTPLFDYDVVYLDMFHRTSRQDFSQLITHLHIWIVRQCARLLQGIGQYLDLELPDLNMKFDDINLSQFKPYLLSKLSTVFSDREVRLIKALTAWCAISPFYQSQMGVISFEKIWEYATKKVFGNIEDTRSGPPSYFIQNKEFEAHGDAIPDILRVFLHAKSSKAVIGVLDAKYYCPKFYSESHIVDGAPANSDIAKQIGYLRYLKQLYPLPSIDFTNAFLFPDTKLTQEHLFEYIGYATPNKERYEEVDKLLGIKEISSSQDRVLLYNVNPTLLFESCLRGVKVDETAFYDDFVVSFRDL